MRTFVGFGFGPIQAGLFLYEAFQSGAFEHLVVAEVQPDVVAEVRDSGGTFVVNIAHRDRIEQARIDGLHIENPRSASDRTRLIHAVSVAQEIGMALPSVNFYASDEEESIHKILAEGLRKKAAEDGPLAVIYCGENHNHAAEILKQQVLEAIPPEEQAAVNSKVCFANTVIGKMSGAVDCTSDKSGPLTPLTLDSNRAFLVEAFNRILISRVHFPHSNVPFERGIAVFEEKEDLLPFEEAKLFGHNATHALAGYLGSICGASTVAELANRPGLLPFLRAAFISESGAALICSHAGVDELFTESGYATYVDDLLERMLNPFLGDSVERVTRDTERKLGWNDRLVGTMRTCLAHGIEPRHYGVGAAAALITAAGKVAEDPEQFSGVARGIWSDSVASEQEETEIMNCIGKGLRVIEEWGRGGFSNIEEAYDDVFPTTL